MGSFELVTVWRSDNCTQICIKFDPVILVIDQPTESILHTKYPWFCFSGNWRHLERCQQCRSPVSAQVVSGAVQWSPGQGKVTTLCLFVLINYTPELLQQSAKSGKLGEKYELVSCFSSQFELSRDIRAWETKTNSKRCKLGGKL